MVTVHNLTAALLSFLHGDWAAFGIASATKTHGKRHDVAEEYPLPDARHLVVSK